ncbi:hypothetical protein EVAR_65932_1 [Eumeta japonica]|uniref:Uncharacterized protein n=1 Tax=Eumeta variegata TaxID=151549 RepID=A0A4C2AEF7_EUMVA|nr:hypothetical protein EVAR_65932_1 [Eumeta japonica]
MRQDCFAISPRYLTVNHETLMKLHYGVTRRAFELLESYKRTDVISLSRHTQKQLPCPACFSVLTGVRPAAVSDLWVTSREKTIRKYAVEKKKIEETLQ